MKKIVKVLVTLMLAVAFVLPMSVIVHAEDTPFDTLSTRDSYLTINSATNYIFFNPSVKKTLSFSEFLGLLLEGNNSVRRIVAHTANGIEIKGDTNLATTDTITIQSITNTPGEGDEIITSYNDIKTYTFILYGDVDKNGRVDIDDYTAIVGHVSGESPITPLAAMALVSGNSFSLIFNGNGSIPTGSNEYNLRISVNPSGTASYVEFNLLYPSFLQYEDYSKPGDMEGWEVTVTPVANAENKLKITAYKNDFNGIQTGVEKRIVNLEFSLKAGTASGTEKSFSVTAAKGVSNVGETIAGGARELAVSVGTVVPTAPTLNTKNESSITLNSVSGYQYYCSSSNAVPAENATWHTASGQTITFSLLEPNTTYYIYYRRNANDTAYLMSDSIKTNAPAALQGPTIESSTENTITVAFGDNFSAIYFSPNSSKPSAYSSWITTESGGGPISGIGSYYVDSLAETVTFTGLSGGKYYITGKTPAGAISEATVWAPTPDILLSDITISGDAVLLPYAAIYKYSIDGVNFFSASKKTNLTSSGSIYIQRETVNGDPNIAAIRGLDSNKEYAIYICVYDGSNVASRPCILTVTTGSSQPSTPPALKVGGRAQIYIAVEFNKSLNYRINNSAWTASFTTYPTETNMITLGDVAYYFSDSTEPTFIIFTKLKPDTSYKIDAKFTSDSTTTTNISTVTTRTLVCNHMYGQKVYVGNTLNYTQTCTICGDVKTGTDTPAHTHTYETVTIPSTCTTKGRTYQICTGCNNILDGSLVELPLAPHTEARRVKSHATCTENGITEVYCSVCGAHIRDEISEAATGHQYTLVTVPSTCKTHGYTVQTCSVCGYVLESSRQELPLLDHDAEWVTTIEPTATSEGKKELICSRCGDVLDTEVIPKLVSYIKNTNGTGTYEITSDENKALVSEAAKLAIADGDASVKVVFPEGVTVELDPAMTVAFLRNNSYLKVTKLTSDADASGNLEKAGFSSATHTVYEITAENAVIANGKATVTVRYAASEDGGAVNVYFVDAQGKKTKLTSNYANGKLTFETTHFSTYVVEQGKAKNSSAGLVIAIIAIVAVILATGGTFGYMVYTSKKTKKRKFNF
ncbi:MAG: hypothetical protein J5832_00640 [Clostridia bacterium]|nr:hypothetical protein [Clostridia bacterium]